VTSAPPRTEPEGALRRVGGFGDGGRCFGADSSVPIRAPFSRDGSLLARMSSGPGSDTVRAPLPKSLHSPRCDKNEETEPEQGKHGISLRRLHLTPTTPHSVPAYPCSRLGSLSSPVRPTPPEMPSVLKARVGSKVPLSETSYHRRHQPWGYERKADIGSTLRTPRLRKFRVASHSFETSPRSSFSTLATLCRKSCFL